MDFLRYGEHGDGPYIAIRRDRVTAVESIWHSRGSYSASRIHVIGGETFDVRMAFNSCRAWFMEDPKDPVLAAMR